MARFRVNTAELASVVKDMASFHRSVEALNEQTATLMGRLPEFWDSDAGAAGQEAHRKLNEAATELGQSLHELAAFLDNARNGYESAIKSNKAMWSE